MKSVLLILTMLISVAYAQRSGGGPGAGRFQGEVFGTVVDSLTEEPLEYVIVALLKNDSVPVKSAVTGLDGNFSLKVAQPGTYSLKIDYLGYDVVMVPNIILNDANPTANLKKVGLQATAMDEVEVVGDKPLVTYELDKKIINVEDQNTNMGQTATEILANVPSVSVDIDGNVSLRGSSSFQVLINGVPSTMNPADALATIPASTIENIEIITNPSAKYDAEGAVGLINIITKKKKLEGVSLLTNVNYGTFNNYGGDLAVSIGKEDWTLNIGANYNNRRRPRDIKKSWTTDLDTSISYVESEGWGGWFNSSYGGNLEFQWNPNASHNLIVAGNYNTRLMRPEYYLTFREYTDGVLQQSNENEQFMVIDIIGYSGSIFYQYNFNRNPDHHLTFKFLSNQRDVDQLDSTMFYNDSEIVGGTKYTEVGPADFNRWDLEYKQPFDNSNFEAGVRVQLGASGDDGRSYFWNTTTNEFDFSSQFSSVVEYTRDVYAGYAMFNQKFNKFSYQLGMRGEYTYRTVEAENFPDFATIRRMDWFPSVHMSWSMNDDHQFMFNSSRRIQRPRSWYFEPFITWESEFNVRTGNPDLTPEYIYVFELSWIRSFGNKGFVSTEGYYRLNNGLIDRISTAYIDNIVMTRPFNIGQSNSAGVELSYQYRFTDWYELNASGNFFYYGVNGDLDNENFDNSSLNGTVRITNTFKYKNWNFQVLGRYESPTATLQGSQEGFFVLDASIRSEFSDRRFAFTLAGRNLLGTQINQSFIETRTLTMERTNIPRWPMVTLTFSMKLNNYKKIMLKHEHADDF